MSILTGQQINLTYPGLLNLATATTGITQNLQAIQDGLGNNTGLRIGTNQLEIPNAQTYVNLKAQYYGGGFSATAPTQMASGTQNVIIAAPIIDKALYAYSALTFNLVTASTTSDTCEAAIYTSQMINPNGLFPSEVIISGLTIPTTGTLGPRTVVFSSQISMSGYGGGVYWIVFKISNAGVQPTVRFGQPIGIGAPPYGMILQNTATGVVYTAGLRYNGSFWLVFSGQTSFANPFGTDLITKQSTSTTLSGPPLGVILHTVGV